jgi:hypothetical protein
LYLGIDIGKNTHAASFMDSSGKVFPNTTEGGKLLMNMLTKHILNSSEVSIGLKPQAIIGYPCFHF